jgi:tartrate-resistant acid phosphatase type 5
MKKYFSFSLIVLPVFSLLCSGCKKSDSPESTLHIIVLGDWGREGTQFQIPVRDQMINDARKNPLNFIISTGDNFYEDGVSSVTDSQWRTSYENIYSDSSLQVPWVVSLGNHDYQNTAEPDAEIAYTSHSKRWIMPARYYQKDFSAAGDNTLSVFIFDTTPFLVKYHVKDSTYHVNSQNTEQQLVWLDSALGACTSKWKFVAGHHPIYSSSKDGGTVELVARMLPILQKHHVQAYICGHNHNLQHIQRDGMDFYVSGAGSQAKDARDSSQTALYSEQQAGFLDLMVTADQTTATFINAWGQTANVSVMKP